MKLIKCHIENFGGLSNRDCVFNSGLTEICEDNGFGKTTLAAFIKAMFYGLPPVRANAKEFNDRKHFYPFSGGKFGGNLTFERGGDEYRIERFFGRKSDTDDLLTVYRNNKIYGGFGGDIGKELFGADKDTFERTVFITADAVDLSLLNGMCVNPEFFTEADGVALDGALGALGRARKELKAAKGSNDLISRTAQALYEKKSEIANLESIARNLDASYAEKNALERKIQLDEARIEELKSANLAAERWEKYDALAAEKRSAEEQLKIRREGYPFGLPDGEEIQTLKGLARQATLLDGAQSAEVFASGKRERLSELSQTFSGGVPDSRALGDAIGGIKSLDARLEALAGADGKRYGELKEKFGGKAPSKAQLDGLERKVERYRELENRRRAQVNAALPAGAPAKKSGIYIALLAVFAAVIAAGVALLFVNTLIGGALLAVGVAAGIADVIFWKRKGAGGAGAVVIDRGAVEMQAELQRTEDEVREALVAYGYYSRNGVVFDFEMFKKDLNDFEQYEEEKAQTQSQTRALQERRRSLLKEAEGVFDACGIDCENLQSAYVTLCNLISEYENLQADCARAEAGAEGTKRQLGAVYAAINGVLGKYNIELSANVSGQIERIAEDAAAVAGLEEELKKREAEMAEFAAKYPLGKRPDGGVEDVSAILEQVKSERNLLAIAEGRIAADEAEIENLGDRYAEAELLGEKLAFYKRRHYILSETEKMIKEADRNLKDKYVAPVKDVFKRYADIIEETLGEKIVLDSDFDIKFEHGGEIHSGKHFSAGLKSICALCLRLAFADNIYGEKPFIIMDDPFVFLDEGHMRNTAKVINALSKDRQIIYLCCHPSRKAEV